MYKADLDFKQTVIDASAKEVLNYRKAIADGFEMVKEEGLLTNKIIKKIQEELEHNRAGFRAVPGTQLKRDYFLSISG